MFDPYMNHHAMKDENDDVTDHERTIIRALTQDGLIMTPTICDDDVDMLSVALDNENLMARLSDVFREQEEGIMNNSPATTRVPSEEEQKITTYERRLIKENGNHNGVSNNNVDAAMAITTGQEMKAS